MLRERSLTVFVSLLVGASSANGADLSVADVVASPGATATVVVSGDIVSGSTYAVTILLELVPRGGNTGTIVFTPEPPMDIVQLGDPWPGAGLFSAYDTLSTSSSVLNGSLDDNGTWIPAPVTYSGLLSGFPVQASANATGVWDVKLATFVGDSNWEGLATTLLDGVITICGDGVANPPEECDDAGESPTCDADCTFVICGDGTLNVTAGEECDDGNTDSGDGCLSTCIVENGWDCTGEPSVCTPAGIPAVSEWGMVVTTLLVLTAGTLVYARRHPRVRSPNRCRRGRL